jgi:hypothetical protein
MSHRIRSLVIALGVVVALAGAASIRVVWLGRDAVADGDAAHERGDLPAAIDAWRAAARHYLPLAPHVDTAYRRLATLARTAETARDPATALAAWRAIRSASRATAGLITPAAELAAEADQRIAALMAADPEGSPAAGATDDVRIAWHAGKLAESPGPGLGLTLLAGLGLLAWIAGLLWFVRGGREVVSLVVAVAGAGLWTIGLYVA